MTLVDFVRDLADHLALGTPLPWAECLASLEQARAELVQTAEGYEEVPAGGEGVADLMREALGLLDQSLERLMAWPTSGDRDELAQAVAEAEEADDLLGLLEYLIVEAQEQQGDHQLA